jgi:tetratricopeptide (TPR) repeat protein
MTRRRGTALAGVLLCWAALLAAPAPARAESLERIFANANAAYFHGDLTRAAAQYQRLVEASVQDPDVYFNLGLTRARLGQLGAAVLCFERSLWLRAGDEMAEAELSAVRARLGGRRAEREGEATVQARPPMAQALVRPLSADFLAWSLLACNVLFFALLSIRPRIRWEAWRLGFAIAIPLVALLLAGSAIGLAVKTGALAEGGSAIVLREGAELREGPDPEAEVRAVAHEGDGARGSRREGAFVHVQLATGPRGWIDQRDIGMIRPH